MLPGPQLASLSCPWLPAAADTTTSVIKSTFALEALKYLIKQLTRPEVAGGGEVAQLCEDALKQLGSLEASHEVFRGAWPGIVYEAIKGNKPKVDAAIIMLMECSQHLSLSGPATLRLSQPTDLLSGNRAYFDASLVQYREAGGRVEVSNTAGEALEPEALWSLFGDGPSITPNRVQTRLYSSGDLEEVDPMAIGDRVKEKIGASWQLLSMVPEFEAWVQRLLRRMLLVPYFPGNLRSGSSSGVTGCIYICDAPDAADFAEMMVHETSHLYFHLATRVSDLALHPEKLYWSPFKHANRPLEKLLIAYHAFGNVALFQGQLSRQLGADSGPSPSTIEGLHEIRGVIESTGDLSAAGRELYEPLTGRLLADGLLRP